MEKRDSKFEVMRIFLILLIIAFHLQRGAIFRSSQYSILFQVVGIWGILGVNGFICISAWFMVGKQEIHVEKILNIIIQVMEYMLMFLALRILKGYVENGDGIADTINGLLDEKQILNIAGMMSLGYWYVRAYVLMALFSPVMNYVLHRITVAQYRIIIVFMSALQFFVHMGSSGVLSDFYTFCYIYMIVGYLSLHRDADVFWVKKILMGGCTRNLLLVAACFILVVVGRGMDKVCPRIGGMLSVTISDYGRHSYTMIFMAIFLFFVFYNMKSFYSVVLN